MRLPDDPPLWRVSVFYREVARSEDRFVERQRHPSVRKEGLSQLVRGGVSRRLLLQETKAWPDQLDAELLESHGYHCVWATAEKKGYSGVSTWSRRAPDDHQIGLGIERFDREGRTVITDHGRLRIFNGYFPNGQRDHGRVPYKLDYYAAVLDAAELARAEGRLVLISGDWNTAHREVDLARPKANRKTTGFLPEECAWMDRWFDAGYHDTFRVMHPDTTGAYSWWSFRSGGARAQRRLAYRLPRGSR